jgi:hypothetical protein
LSTGTSESSIVFYNGGHNHDGISSALIDVSKYSLYDFTTDFLGTSARQTTQAFNYGKFKEVISRIVKEDVLTTAGIKLLPNEVKAENITAGAITADKLSANIVLVNNRISSNNFDGTIAANGVITGDGTAGWAITSAGDAVFSAASIRGVIQAGALYLNANNFWDANGDVSIGDLLGSAPGLYYDSANSVLAINGSIFANSGQIASFIINGDYLSTGGSFLGEIGIGPYTTGYGDVDAGAVVIQTRDYDFNLVTSILRGQDLDIHDMDSDARTIVNKYGLQTTGGIVYGSYSGNQIAFYWDGTDIYAVIDDTTLICLTQCGTGPAVTPAVTPGVTPAVTPACTPCPTECCPPGQSCYPDLKNPLDPPSCA